MTTLIKKTANTPRRIALRLTHEDGRLAGAIIHQPAKTAGVIARWLAQPADGGEDRTFFSMEAAELYITAFATEAEYVARAKENGCSLNDTIFENGTMYGAIKRKGEAA